MIERMASERRWTGSAFASTLASCLIFLAFMEIFASRQIGADAVAADYQSFYAAGYIARTNPAHLYDLAEQSRVQSALISRGHAALPYFHPAYEALVYVPFSLVPYRLSYGLFIGFNVALLMLIVVVFPSLGSEHVPLLNHWPGIALFTFVPVLIAILQGQDSILFLLLCCCLWRVFRQKMSFLSGFVVALMLFRFQLALPLFAVLLFRRGWKLLPGFAAGLCMVGGICFAMVGQSGLAAWFRLLSSSSLSSNHSAVVQNVMAIHPLAMPNLFGMAYAAGAQSMQPAHATALVIAASAAAFLWTAWLSQRLTLESDVFAVALLCSILVSYHMYLHDLCLLIVPLALLRTRTALYLGSATYALAFAVVFYGGAEVFFLLAIPNLLLLCFGWRKSAEPAKGKRPYAV